MEAVMENKKINPFNQIQRSINRIRKSYNNLFLVPSDQGKTMADRSMPMDQINDTIAFAIQNHSVVKMQINLKVSVVEITGYIKITRSGRLCITDPSSDLTQILEDQQFRSIEIL